MHVVNVYDDHCEDIQNTPPPKKIVPSPSMVFFYGFFNFSDPNVLENKTPWGDWGAVWRDGCGLSSNHGCHKPHALPSKFAFRSFGLADGVSGKTGLCNLKASFFFCYLFRVWFFFWAVWLLFLGPGLPSRSPRAKDFKLVGRSHIILNS